MANALADPRKLSEMNGGTCYLFCPQDAHKDVSARLHAPELRHALAAVLLLSFISLSRGDGGSEVSEASWQSTSSRSVDSILMQVTARISALANCLHSAKFVIPKMSEVLPGVWLHCYCIIFSGQTELVVVRPPLRRARRQVARLIVPGLCSALCPARLLRHSAVWIGYSEQSHLNVLV